MTVVTRFAPSPTGFLHIGGARTALFNWLYAKHCGGKFLLRIEDTDRARSTKEAVEAILDGLRWLGLDWDEEPVFQHTCAARHEALAQRLLEEGKAYRCYASPEELDEMRQKARKESRPMRYDGRWRDRNPSEAPPGVDPVIRLKAPRDGESVISDLVQGEISVSNDQLDDMILLRSDGTPTYMLAVVVDDHDMGVTHVIRGDDHLTNAFRQAQLYQALGLKCPEFAHVPLIHGADGAKLSKRHGALGVDAYREMGILPDALRNYLLRLGWGHGDDEIISTEQAVSWFDLDGVGRSAARFDFAKLTNLNAHYMRHAEDHTLCELIMPLITEKLEGRLAEGAADRIKKGMLDLKERAKTALELSESAEFYAIKRPIPVNEKAANILSEDAQQRLKKLSDEFSPLQEWSAENLENATRRFSEAEEIKLGKVAQPLRAALTGSTVSPPIFGVMEVLGRDETMGRIKDALENQVVG
jgi:glutamyl-tRNA synthetase